MDFVFSQMLPPVETGIPKHTNASSRSRLEDGLDAKRQRGRSEEDGRSVAGCLNHAIRGIEAQRLANRWQHCEDKGGVGDAMHGGRLHKRSVHRGHSLAAILSVMTVRRARHRIAALHRLFWCRRGAAVERARRKSDCQHRQKNWLGQTHP